MRILLIVSGILSAPSAAAAQAASAWSLAPPHFEVGGIFAEDEYALAELGGVTILENGNVVVGDRIEPFLKVFDPQGTFLRTVGRFGEGPGELQYVYDMDWCAPGVLRVHDVDGRMHRYSGDMEFIETEVMSLEAIGGGTGYRHDCHPNGYRIATGWGDFRAHFKEGLHTARAPAALLRDRELVAHFGERLSSERLGSVRADGSPAGSGPHPFGRATVVAIGSDRAYLGDGTDYRIEVFNLNGESLPSITWDGPDLEYDPALIDRLAEAAVNEAPERQRPDLRRWYAEMPELEQLPAYDRLLVSDTDQLWVREFVRPAAVGENWVVFEGAQLVGRLQLPARSTLWEVRGDVVVYSTLDEYDVPLIRLSRLVR